MPGQRRGNEQSVQRRPRRAAVLVVGGALILLVSGIGEMETGSRSLGWLMVTVGNVTVLVIIARWREGPFRPPPRT
jgi:hypothetical protein